MNKYYAGVGSRETPGRICKMMRRLSSKLCPDYILRSGGAGGADSAFYFGLTIAERKERSEIYLPDFSFNSNVANGLQLINSQKLPKWPDAKNYALRFHPAPEKLKGKTLNLMARNTFQVLGPDLDDPVDFVLCWTENGEAGGGTGQAIRIAEYCGIPVNDLGDPKNEKRAEDFLQDRLSLEAFTFRKE